MTRQHIALKLNQFVPTCPYKSDYEEVSVSQVHRAVWDIDKPAASPFPVHLRMLWTDTLLRPTHPWMQTKPETSTLRLFPLQNIAL